jgi:hypothetical protein
MEENKIIEQLQVAFAPVAEKIGEGASFGWEVIIRQQIISGVLDVVIGVLGIFLAYFIYKLVRFFLKKQEENCYGDWGLGAWLIAIFGSIPVVIMISCLFIGINKLLNPAYYAIKFLLEVIK